MQTATAHFALSGLSQQPLAVLREHRWLLGLVLAYALSCLLLAWWLGVLGRISFSLYADHLLVRYAIWFVLFAFCYPIYVMTLVRPKRLIRHMADDLWLRLLTLERLMGAALVLGVLPIFMSAYTSIKVMIPLVQPFDWDVTFAAWDRWLHGDRHPWEILQPLLGHFPVTYFLSLVYFAWFLVVYGIVCWQAFARSRPLLRMQFFVSMLLCWALLGSLAAMLLSSAGPCYFGRVTGLPDPFAPLMGYLQEADRVHAMWVLPIQDLLWQTYQSGILEKGMGISAMPSMHVSAVVLAMLFGWRINRSFGLALTLFALLTFLGSIHLGWHYAIDGYAAAAGTLAIWWAVGRLLRRDPAFRAVSAIGAGRAA